MDVVKEKNVEKPERVIVLLQPSLDEGNVDIKAALRVLLGSYLVIFSFVLLGAALALTHVFSAAHRYRSQLIATVSEDAAGLGGINGGQLGSLASLVGVNIGMENGRQAEYIARLSSRALITAFIQQHNLLPELFARRWDKDKSVWLDDGKPPPTMNQAVDMFLARVLKVKLDSKTGLVTLSIEWFDRSLTAQWANDLVGLLNDKVRSDVILQSRQSIELLNKEADAASALAVREAIFKLVEANLNRATLANARKEYALKVIDPAIVADANRYVWPRPMLELAAGIFLGGMVGCIFILLRRKEQWWTP